VPELQQQGGLLNPHCSTPALAALVLGLVLCAAPIGVPAQTGAAPVPAAEPPPLRFTVRAFRVTGENPLDAARTEAVLAPFRGEYSGVEGLFEAASTLEKALADAGHSFRRVVLPAQTLEEGTVTLEVVAFKLGRVVVEGNQHFSRDNVLRSLPGLVSGETPRPRRLAQQRWIANLHPSKQVELRLKESDTALAIDAHVAVQDSAPENLFLGINNTGNNATGDFRIVGGFQHSNLSGRDDQITVSTTVSPTKIDRVEQIGASYALPLYALGGRIDAFYATSDVDSGTVQGVFDVAGAGDFLGVSYTHYLPRMGGYTHSVRAGIDDKRFDNTVNFLGLPLGVDVRSRPIAIGYDASYEHARGASSLHLTYVRNIPRGKRNSSFNYNASRLGADPVWDAVRFGAAADVALPRGWLLRLRGDGQLTDEPLISGEQFGVGVARSVRGYEERELSGDAGLFASAEAWTPPLEVLHDARLLLFLDAGQRRSKSVQPGETKADNLVGAGVGVRWFLGTRMSVEFDLARPFNEAGITRTGDLRAHFNAFLRF